MRRFFASRVFLFGLLLALVAIALRWPRTAGFMWVFGLAAVMAWFAFVSGMPAQDAI